MVGSVSQDLFERKHSRSSVGVVDLIEANSRIEVLSAGGETIPIPARWFPLLDHADAMVLIPDMHMFLYNSNLDNFRFGAEAMLHLLQYLLRLQRDLAAQHMNLRVYQLGDMYELCYPNSRGGRVRVNDIALSHPMYGEIVSLFSQLKTQFVAGNHDYAYHRKQGNRASVLDGRVYLEHGFAADNWYHFTDPTRFPWRVSELALLGFRQMEAVSHRIRNRFGLLDNDDHAAVGVDSGNEERTELPPQELYPKRILQYYSRLISQMHWYQRPRICAVAHTHHPVVSTSFMDGECLYVDAGAWTEGRSDFVVITNEDLAICRYRREAPAAARQQLRSAG